MLGTLWARVSLLWAQYKLYAMLAILLITAVWSFQAGKDSCQERAIKALETELKAQEARAAKAIQKAASDSRRLTEAKGDTDELLKQLEKASASGTCIPSFDELRLLREIAQKTAVE